MKMILFIYQWIFLFPVFFIITVITAFITIVGCLLGGHRFWGYYPGKIWSIIACILSFVKIEVEGYENIDKKSSYVFVANHQGAYDIFLIYGYLKHNFKWLMKEELRKMPFMGRACVSAGHIFLNRSSMKSMKESLTSAIGLLKNGMSVVVFPEGTRSFDGKLGRFKKGAYQMAVDLQLPIVPLTIDGSFHVMSRNSLRWRPGKIKMTIHKPIIPVEQTDQEVIRLMQESKHIIEFSLNSDKEIK